MATSNPSTFFTFHAGKRLRIDYVNDQPEIYEIDTPELSSTIEEVPSKWKKLKIYDRRNFIPLEIGFLLNQKDLFYEIISCFDFKSILMILRCVCKTWNNWIMIDFDKLWKNRYEKMCNFEFSEDLLKNCQHSFLFNCHILESAMKKNAEYEEYEKEDYEMKEYEFSQDPDYEKIKKMLQPRLFVLHFEESSKYILKQKVTEVNITSMLNLGENGFVKFRLNYSQFNPKHGEPEVEITVEHEMVLMNNSFVEVGKKGSPLLKAYHSYGTDVERNDELIAQIMSVIGIDRNLIRAFIMLVTFDVAFNHCTELYGHDFPMSFAGSAKFEQPKKVTKNKKH